MKDHDPNPRVGASVRARPDPMAAAERKARLLELLAIFVRQGHVTPGEVDASLGRPPYESVLDELKDLRERVSEFEAERAWSDAERGFLEEGISGLEADLRTARERAAEHRARIAALEEQLQTARRTTVRLIDASATSLSTLKQVRSELAVENPATDVLDPLFRNLQAVASAVQDLDGLALGAAARARTPDRTPPPLSP